jgi:hypothetical protein
MNTKVFEFQAKGSHAPVFTLKTPDFSSDNLMGPDKKIFIFNDGERFIGKVIEEVGDNVKYWTVEDTEGNITTINSCIFHKITDPRNFSKKFKYYKVNNHILD